MNIDHKTFNEQLAQLVATPSVSCTNPKLDMGNRQVIDLLASWLDDLGLDVDIQTVDGNPHKANLIATLGEPNPDGQGGLVFSGHADTVPYDEKRWNSDPFTLHIENDRAYGLGATDMKGFFPTVIAAIQPFLNTKLREPIIILATADEETSMSGARALLQHPIPKAQYGIVGEPTNMTPIRMHKGIGMESIKVRGRSGHSSDPSLGHNALDVMHEVITDLKHFRQQLQTNNKHPGFTIDVPTLNLGSIHGGDNPNRICGHCELEFDLRTLPGMSLDDLRHDIDKQLHIIADKHQIIIERESLFSGVEAFEQEQQSEFIQYIESLTGKQTESVAFATEAPFLKSMGLDVVVMGPGSIDQAHQPDEFIDLNQITPAIEHWQALIKYYCV